MILTRCHDDLTDELRNTIVRDHVALFKNARVLTQNKPRQSVRECTVNGVPYIIKRYLSGSPLGAVRLLCRSTRADNSFKFAGILARHGITTPKHLLVIKNIGLIASTTYLIMEKSRGTAFFDYIQPGSQEELPAEALLNIRKLVQSLQDLDIRHGDLHTRNILIMEDNSVEIIDLDGATFSKKGKQKDLRRLAKALHARTDYWEVINSPEPARG